MLPVKSLHVHNPEHQAVQGVKAQYNTKQMGFNMHTGHGPKSRIDVLWTFSRKKYTIQECIVH